MMLGYEKIPRTSKSLQKYVDENVFKRNQDFNVNFFNKYTEVNFAKKVQFNESKPKKKKAKRNLFAKKKSNPNSSSQLQPINLQKKQKESKAKTLNWAFNKSSLQSFNVSEKLQPSKSKMRLQNFSQNQSMSNLLNPISQLSELHKNNSNNQLFDQKSYNKSCQESPSQINEKKFLYSSVELEPKTNGNDLLQPLKSNSFFNESINQNSGLYSFCTQINKTPFGQHHNYNDVENIKEQIMLQHWQLQEKAYQRKIKQQKLQAKKNYFLNSKEVNLELVNEQKEQLNALQNQEIYLQPDQQVQNLMLKMELVSNTESRSIIKEMNQLRNLENSLKKIKNIKSDLKTQEETSFPKLNNGYPQSKSLFNSRKNSPLKAKQQINEKNCQQLSPIGAKIMFSFLTDNLDNFQSSIIQSYLLSIYLAYKDVNLYKNNQLHSEYFLNLPRKIKVQMNINKISKALQSSFALIKLIEQFHLFLLIPILNISNLKLKQATLIIFCSRYIQKFLLTKQRQYFTNLRQSHLYEKF